MYRLTNGSEVLRITDGALIPADSANTDYKRYLAWIAAGNRASPYVPPVPQSVTPLQASRALLAAGLLDDVEAAIAVADRETQLAWQKATAVERNSPFVAKLAAAIRLTSAQVDQLFVTAATL